MKNNFEIIDAHCHIYPEKIARAAVDGTDGFYGLHSVYGGTTADLLQRGRENGIDRFVVQSVATTPHQVSKINHFIAEAAALNAEFTGVGTLHPESEDIAADIDELVSLGLHGVKLHPDIQRFCVDDPRCLNIYEKCSEKGLPILIHTGDYRYDFSNPNRMKPILQTYTDLTVIGAHFGGWSVWDDAAREMAGLPNLYVDTSSSFYSMTKEKALSLIRAYGPGHVLFGTDYPMWNGKDELDFMFSLDLTDADFAAILSENAKRVYAVDK